MLLSAQNVALSYDNTPIIQNLSFEVGKGEVFCILGESGCGKTTLLKAIRGFMDFDEGQIIFNGDRVFNKSEKLVPGTPGIGVVYQDFQLEAGLTVFHNIRHHLIKFRRDYQEAKTEEILDLCGLRNLRDRFPKQLSGGQKQKVALAKAVIEEPPMILLDEPFSHLDAISKREFKMILRNVVKELGIALVFVTHDAKDALSFSDRIMILEKGKLLQIGTPKEMVNQPINAYAGRLLGLTNILKGKNIQAFTTQKLNTEQAYWVPQYTIETSEGNLTPNVINHYGDSKTAEFLLDDEILEVEIPSTVHLTSFSIKINTVISLD